MPRSGPLFANRPRFGRWQTNFSQQPNCFFQKKFKLPEPSLVRISIENRDAKTLLLVKNFRNQFVSLERSEVEDLRKGMDKFIETMAECDEKITQSLEGDGSESEEDEPEMLQRSVYHENQQKIKEERKKRKIQHSNEPEAGPSKAARKKA